jgi:adenine/guanine phosphoribosyltransferase-like PRPP-binding protein
MYVPIRSVAMEADPRLASTRIRTADCCLYGDRSEAGAKLAALLHAYRKHNPIVIGISRAGMRVACEVALQLGAELDVMAVRTVVYRGKSTSC